MIISRFSLLLLAFVVALTWGTLGARASDDSILDHERARQAIESGAAVPLSQALEKVEKLFPGRVIEVELEEEIFPTVSGDIEIIVYEMKVLTPEGNLLNVYLHAKTLELLEVEGRDD